MSRNGSIKNSGKLLTSGIEFQSKGMLIDAEQAFLRVLKNDPNSVPALYSLAAICENTSRFEQGLSYINRAIKLNPKFAQAFLAKSIILTRLSRPTDALIQVEHALSIDPELAGARAHRELLSRAIAGNHPLVEGTPGAIDGAGLAMANELSKAIDLQSSGHFVEAASLLKSILETDPNNFVALYSLGTIFSQAGDSKNALLFMTRAVSASPESAMGYHALGTVQQGLGLFEDALRSFDQALVLRPDYKDVFVNKCSVLHSLNRQLDAVDVMQKALGVFPDDPTLLNNLGYLLTEFKQYSQSVSFFKRLIDIDPFYENAQGLHAYARLHACDWTDFEGNKQRIIDGINQGRRVCNPMALMALTDDPETHQKCAVEFGKVKFPVSSKPLWSGQKYNHRRRRIAFISADFREHPVGYLLIELIEKLPGYGFETIGIFTGHDDGSELYSRYRQGFTHYLSCQDKTAIDIANVLFSFECDVAIDLAGYTSGTRLDVLAHRPCPVQATYLGFPGTLGLPYIDYLIADHFIVPEDQSSFYSERVIRLPHTYLPRDTSIIPSGNFHDRSHCDLPEHGIVFCSFNHDYKINPPMFDVWMQLLREYDDSVLWLMQLNDDARGNLEKEAQLRDVNPSRLLFASRVPKIQDHLARYRHVDLFLDTFPYGGHTTASDALFMDTPLVSLAGKSFASRVASCMLTDQGKGDNIAYTFEQYLSNARKAIDHRIPRPPRHSYVDHIFRIESFVNCLDQMT
jgi:protein O-GlcNAc transferase